MTDNQGIEKVEMEYHCRTPKCGYVFKRLVGRIATIKGKVKGISDQVVCPRCGNFMKTWE